MICFRPSEHRAARAAHRGGGRPPRASGPSARPTPSPSSASTARSRPAPVQRLEMNRIADWELPGERLAHAALQPDADPPLRRRRDRSSRRRPRAPPTRRPRSASSRSAWPRRTSRTTCGSSSGPAPTPDRSSASGSASSRPAPTRGDHRPRPRRHRPRPHVRIAARAPPGGGGVQHDRDRHAPDEGDARPRRRAGPGAGHPLRGSPVTDRRYRESIDDLDALLGALPPEIVEAIHALPERVGADRGRHGPRPPARGALPGERGDPPRPRGHRGGHRPRRREDRLVRRRQPGRASSGRSTGSARSGTGTARSSGLTCRIGRAVYGTIEIIDDFVETGKSILIMGRPGIGKTTMLREAARVLADDLGKRVVVVDTSQRDRRRRRHPAPGDRQGAPHAGPHARASSTR